MDSHHFFADGCSPSPVAPQPVKNPVAITLFSNPGAPKPAANPIVIVSAPRPLEVAANSSISVAVTYRRLQSPVPAPVSRGIQSDFFECSDLLFTTKTLKFSLAYESEDLVPPGVASLIFADYDVLGLADASEKYSSRNLSSPIKANLHFSLCRSGIFSLDRAEAVIEITEWVEVPRKNLTTDNSTCATSNTTDANANNSSEDSKDKLETNYGKINVSDLGTNNSSTVDLGTEMKLKKRTFRVPLKVIEKTTGAGMPLSKESFGEARLKLEALDKKDAERRRTAELKNNLEGYIYSTKDKLESEEFEKISSEQERKSFLEKLNEVEDWLYTDGEEASATEFEERLYSLKSFGDPIFFRHTELTARPAASEHAWRYLTEITQIVEGWEKDKSWLPRERIDEVLGGAEKLKSWLSEKEAEQKKTSAISKPAFTSDGVYEKILDLQNKVVSVNRIPKPKTKIEKTVKMETEDVDDKANIKDSASEEASSSKDQTKGESDDAVNNKADAESNGHEEL